MIGYCSELYQGQGGVMGTFQKGDIVRWTKESDEWTVKNEFSAQRKYWIQLASDDARGKLALKDDLDMIRRPEPEHLDGFESLARALRPVLFQKPPGLQS